MSALVRSGNPQSEHSESALPRKRTFLRDLANADDWLNDASMVDGRRRNLINPRSEETLNQIERLTFVFRGKHQGVHYAKSHYGFG
jgi:hypothetical protein